MGTISLPMRFIDLMLEADNPSMSKVALYMFTQFAESPENFISLSIYQIQSATGMSHPTTIRALHELRQLGIIEVRSQKGRPKNKPNAYRLQSSLLEQTKNFCVQDEWQNRRLNGHSFINTKVAAEATQEYLFNRGIGITQTDLISHLERSGSKVSGP